MCLTNAKKLRDDHDELKCYKLLQWRGYDLCLSPYQGMVYRKGENVVAEGTKNVHNSFLDAYGIEVDGGFLHTFMNLRAVLEYLSLSYTLNVCDNYVIAECTIPRNCEVYEGVFTHYGSYASESLHVDRFIPKKEIMEVAKTMRRIFADQAEMVARIYMDDYTWTRKKRKNKKKRRNKSCV